MIKNSEADTVAPPRQSIKVSLLSVGYSLFFDENVLATQVCRLGHPLRSSLLRHRLWCSRHKNGPVLPCRKGQRSRSYAVITNKSLPSFGVLYCLGTNRFKARLNQSTYFGSNPNILRIAHWISDVVRILPGDFSE